MTSMLWNISIGQLGYLSACAPSHSCTPAHQLKLEKVLDFIGMTENINVFSIVVVLNPKHSSYWEEN